MIVMIYQQRNYSAMIICGIALYKRQLLSLFILSYKHNQSLSFLLCRCLFFTAVYMADGDMGDMDRWMSVFQQQFLVPIWEQGRMGMKLGKNSAEAKITTPIQI